MTSEMTRAPADALSGDVFDQKTAQRLQALHSDPIYAWICQQFEDKRDGSHLYRIELSHQNVTNHLVTINSWPIATCNDAVARATTAAIQVSSGSDAETRNTHHEIYAIVAIWPNTDHVQHIFALDGATRRDRSVSAGPSEPANLEGALRMQFRHNELLMKLLTQSQDQSHRYTSDLIQQLSARVKTLDEGRFRVLELSENLLNAQAERQAEQSRVAASEARKQHAFESFMNWMPVLQGKLAEKLTGAKMAGDNPFMKQFVATLDMSDVDKLIGSIDDPGKKLLLYEAILSLQKEQAASAPKRIAGTAQIAMTPAPDPSKPPPGGNNETH